MASHATSNGNGPQRGPQHGDFTTLERGRVATRSHGGSELSVRFDRGPTAAQAARSALIALEPRVDPQVLDDIRLLVSELVTNAIRHAEAADGGEVGLDVTIDQQLVRVEVADPGAGFDPTPRDDEMSRPGGWGLYLVDRIADRWGVVRNRMTRVWFEIDSATA